MKKLFFNVMLVLMLIFASVLCVKLNVNASEEYEYITKTNGEYLTYRGTSLKVEVPKNYNQKSIEFRGVWVSPFAGDISGFTLTQEVFQNELLSVLDTMEKYNLNAIMFHLRTHNDALYNTNLAPMSSYIKAANFRKWDYVSWFIEECHSRGIEFHAWLNPYRISSSSITMSEILKKYQDYRSNPACKEENILIGKNGAILDPGSPEVKEYLVDVCMEIVKKYDVDAIHFDDYFYMDGIDDYETYKQYKENYNNVDIKTFRRLQVDDFIESLSKEMYDYNIENNKAVQLGISPSGVYRNGSYSNDYQYDENGTLVSPLYSNTAGYEHYGAPLYSDTKKWIDNEWIDYITPQLYGSFESAGCCYADALDWWAQVVKYKKVNLYAGLGIYKSLSDGSDVGWYTKGNRTFELQLKYNQTQEQVDGFCLYQYRSIKTKTINNPDYKYVFENMLTNKAITPEVPRYSIDINKVENLKLIKGKNTTTLLFDEVDKAYKYAIYKVDGLNKQIDINDPSQLVAIIGNKETNSFIEEITTNDFTYGICAISQSNKMSDMVTISSDKALTEIDIPFAKINAIDVSKTIATDEYYTITFERASVIIGENVSYKIYRSYDKENWEMISEIAPFTSLTANTKLKFNNYMSPEYVKLVIVSEFGEIESDVILVDYRKLDIIELFDYSLDNIKESILNIFK